MHTIKWNIMSYCHQSEVLPYRVRSHFLVIVSASAVPFGQEHVHREPIQDECNKVSN